MQEIIQFVQSSPEELTNRICERFKADLDNLKSEFQPRQPQEFLTRTYVKEWLNVDMSTIHNWTKSGKLKAYGIGNRIYYKRTEVEQALIPLKSTTAHVPNLPRRIKEKGLNHGR